MEVILKQDIPNLGYANEIVSVKNGYARNYLIPKGYAVLASPSNKKMTEEIIRQKAFKAEKVRMQAQDLATALQNITVKIGAKAAPTGKIYGSVNAVQIADAIREQFGYEVDRKKIHVDGESIKDLGTYTARIILHKEAQAEITFEVFAE
ncbi:MAG TPA: 50S ribosomal protein L9 [Bacteroidales bacterium]|nr:50S ribosomal protein L9 [Bacteroidales bacterium]HSA43156.1 50S ribosomal protein L9 [Bacteroidales bacterium]